MRRGTRVAILSAVMSFCGAAAWGQVSTVIGRNLPELTSPANGDVLVVWEASPVETKKITLSTLQSYFGSASRVITCTPPLLCDGGASMTLAADRTLSVRLPVVYAADHGVAAAASAATNDAGITAALAALATSGGIVHLPCGNPIDISATITIGNATTTTKSTRNGITFTACGEGADNINMSSGALAAATRLRWTGAAGGTMLKVNGPIQGVKISGMTLDANGLAATGIYAQRAFALEVSNVTITKWTGYAIKSDADSSYPGGGDGGAGAPMHQLWRFINAVDPGAATASALALGENDVCTCNTNELTFESSVLERGSSADAVGVWLGNVDHVAFLHTFFLQRGSTTGKAVVVAAQPSATSFPANITFIASPLIGGVFQDNAAAAWNGAVPALIFYPFYTADSQAIPPVGAAASTLDADLVAGVTDTGLVLSGSQQFTLTSAQGLAANQTAAAVNGILFNGATADANQTLLTVADPTADRTVTIPNVSGTLVTSGDSGSVTDGMLAGNYSGIGACGASTWASTLNDNAAPTCTQPNYSDLTGDSASLSNGSGLLRVLTSGGVSQIQSGLVLAGGSAAPVRFGSIFLSNLWLDISTSGNIGVGTSSYGASAAGVVAIKNGTAPTTSPADTNQLWSADTAAGDANLYSRNEAGIIEQLTGLRKRVKTQFDKTSDVTLANVTDLTFNVEAGKSYGFSAVLFTTSDAAGGIKAAIGGTATATSLIYEGDALNAATFLVQTRATTLGSAVCAVTAVTVARCDIKGTITVNAAGTLTVQFAQNASNAAASSVLVGSQFYLEPIGN